jgi:hypothetical protein
MSHVFHRFAHQRLSIAARVAGVHIYDADGKQYMAGPECGEGRAPCGMLGLRGANVTRHRCGTINLYQII